MTPPNPGQVLRFGDFELDVAAYELRRAGRAVRLERRPMDLLMLLALRPGQLVSRAEIVDKLWGKDVFVDVETGVHTAARKVRQALGDSAEAPVYIETVSGKGYRFVAAVDVRSPPLELPPRSLRKPLIAAVVASALAALAGSIWLARSPGHVTLAVLPFEDLSGGDRFDYLAGGLAEELTVSLGQIDPERLSVLGRTSTNVYRGTRKSAAAVGRELGVDFLVESSLRSERDRVRITATLIRVRDQLQVWSATYDRTPDSILGLQSELSTAIAEQIRLRLSPERVAALAQRHTRNPDAYDTYLRGLNAMNQRTPATNKQAVDLFARAVALDPAYALAWAGLAQVYAAGPINADAPPREMLPLARTAAYRAVQSGASLAEAHQADAYVKWMLEWDWPAAEAGFRRAIALDGAYAPAHRSLGHLLSQMGRHTEGLAAMQRSRELEPGFALAHALSAQVAFQARDYRAAVEHASQAIVMEPAFWIGYMQRAQAYEQLGDAARALDDAERAVRFSGANSKAVSLRGYVLARSGRAAEARDLLRSLLEASATHYVPPYAAALVHAGLGERAAAHQWLERAYEARDVHLIYLPVDAKWDSYRAESWFQTLLTRCRFIDPTTRTAQSPLPPPRSTNPPAAP